MSSPSLQQSLLAFLQGPVNDIAITNTIEKEQFIVPERETWYKTRNDLVIAEWQDFNAETFFTNTLYTTHRALLEEIKIEAWKKIDLPLHVRSYNEIVRIMYALVEMPVSNAMHHVFFAGSSETNPRQYVARFEEPHTGFVLAAGGAVAPYNTDPKKAPTYAFFPLDTNADQCNRLPGVLKPSWHWSSKFDDPNYTTVLAEINCHMEKCGTKYGFVLTDKEMVAVRRDPAQRFHLQVAPAVPFSAASTISEEILTVKLAVWWLGMLAANDDEWAAPVSN